MNTITELKAMGFEADLLLLNAEQHPFLKKLQQQPHGNIIKLSYGSVYNPLLVFKLIPHLSKYNLIHVHLFPSLYWVALAKLISNSKTKLIFTEHNTFNRRRNKLFFKYMDRLFYKQYTKVIAVSNEVKYHLKEHLGRYFKNYITIPNGVCLENFKNDNEVKTNKISEPGKIYNLIQISAFTKQKDQETLLKAIPYLTTPVRVFLVGDGPEKKRMEHLSEDLEITDKVQFLGNRIDIGQLLHDADIAILSSNYEGMSLAGVEAMASGTPLIASDVPGLKTLVYGAGMLFHHKDEIDLANKINKLLTNRTLYNQVANSCELRAQEYSFQTMLAAHIALYKEIHNE